MSHRQALDTLKREAGKQWDPEIVNEFVTMIEEEWGLNGASSNAADAAVES
jgi:HD-GYP domain-containing protein (c-di-GMP phosphodiesterase class II)